MFPFLKLNSDIGNIFETMIQCNVFIDGIYVRSIEISLTLSLYALQDNVYILYIHSYIRSKTLRAFQTFKIESYLEEK